MELKSIVPWGRSFSEYQKMFLLSEIDLQKNILGCGDGPASFNAESTAIGSQVVSIDPVYQFNGEQILSRINEVYPQVMEQMLQNKDAYVWDSINSVEELGKVRMKAMNAFLDDYEVGKISGRYIFGSLPSLPFSNKEFELALCSHYLFLYSDHVSQEQHISSIRELCRVASEVRIYPVLSLDGNQSMHLKPVISALADDGIESSLEHVNYEFQKGATEMFVAKSV